MYAVEVGFLIEIRHVRRQGVEHGDLRCAGLAEQLGGDRHLAGTVGGAPAVQHLLEQLTGRVVLGQVDVQGSEGVRLLLGALTGARKSVVHTS